MLLHITYEHIHFEVDLHPPKTMQCNAPRDHNTGQDLWRQNTNTHSVYGHHNFRQQRKGLSPFDLWSDWDFLRSLTSRSGSRDTNIQESDDQHCSSVRFSIVCRKECSEFFIKQSVFEESSKCPIPTNKHPGWSQSIPLSVAGELLNAS